MNCGRQSSRYYGKQQEPDRTTTGITMTLRERVTALATVHRVFLALSVIFLASAAVLVFRGEWLDVVINGALAVASGWYPVRYIIRPYASNEMRASCAH